MIETAVQDRLQHEQAIDQQQTVGCHRSVLINENRRTRTNEWMPCPEPATHYAVFHHPGDRIVVERVCEAHRQEAAMHPVWHSHTKTKLVRIIPMEVK